MKSCTTLLVTALALGLSTMPACKSREKTASPDDAPSTQTEILGKFDADSAYTFVAQQVAFGPRVPGTPGHTACRDWIVDKLRSYGADSIIVQNATVTAFNGDCLPISNIIAQFNKLVQRRILLVAHWDTRPWADECPDPERRNEPIPGANDGASGVAVLLEIARNLAMEHPNAGVDLFFTDAEDYGKSTGFDNNEETWCLGTQYWVKNMTPYTPDNLPVYGILLDMVGGKDARFHQEAFSQTNARTITDKVWSEAQWAGHADRFIPKVGGAVVDDHIFLSRAGIPTTDIIECNSQATSTFPISWHTHNDNLSNISPRTLLAVGQTVLNIVYKEKAY